MCLLPPSTPLVPSLVWVSVLLSFFRPSPKYMGNTSQATITRSTWFYSGLAISSWTPISCLLRLFLNNSKESKDAFSILLTFSVSTADSMSGLLVA